MKYLLDTDTCIAILRGNPATVERVRETVPDDLAIAAITRYELRFGVLRCSPERVKRESRKLNQFLEILHEIPFIKETAEHAAQIRHQLESLGKPIGPMDTLIAATALEYNLILVTGNVREFSRVTNLQIENWMA